MISLRKITLENRRELFKLKVADYQSRFVATNLSSIASCYILDSNGGCPLPFAIYANEEMVGFVMIVYGITGYEVPNIANNNYCILRFMISEQYQKQGYGKKAMRKILEHLRTFPAGHAQYCWIPYVDENIVAKKLYESFGFCDTGEVINDNEHVTVLKL
ncbi:N-acetyltransferase [Paenibacillus albidus]|uniref:N-acetyltransferase n=1 Tax=Paenibacillus albidus TaxID=2041023 RepID=A0A917FR89_9BACL|nr:GNAT family N-acetyltransferase [Paenibacillus albidus]GGF98976.1 N-acetyltransferase [Paenibacillus albidus]